MNKWALRILVHLVSVLIAMPFGWCCWLPTAAAQKPKEQTESCCCGHAAPAKTPAPATPTEEKPEAPSCCCDPQSFAILIDGSDGIDVKPVAAFTVLPSYIAEAFLDPCVGWFSVPFLHTKSPPLHLLHCVWLC